MIDTRIEFLHKPSLSESKFWALVQSHWYLFSSESFQPNIEISYFHIIWMFHCIPNSRVYLASSYWKFKTFCNNSYCEIWRDIRSCWASQCGHQWCLVPEQLSGNNQKTKFDSLHQANVCFASPNMWTHAMLCELRLRTQITWERILPPSFTTVWVSIYLFF